MTVVTQKRFFSYLYSVARYKTFQYNRDRGRLDKYQQQWDELPIVILSGRTMQP